MGIMQKHEWEFRLKDGNCRVQAVRDNIIRCSYTKRENWEQKSPVGIKVCPESSFSVSEDGEKLFSGQREWFWRLTAKRRLCMAEC